MRWGCAAAFSILIAVSGAGAAADDAFLPEHTKIGEFIATAPPLPAPPTAFTDLQGNPVRLADFTGKPAVLNLWATWCEPCRREMASLDRLQARLGDRLRVVLVSEDRGGAAAVGPFFEKLDLGSLKTYVDPKSAVGRAFGVRGLPTSIVLDRDGRVVGTVEGAAEWDSAKILAILEPLLGGDAVVKSSLRRAPP
jgi:thiol-disulfide isomerase/thioredoxin